MTALTVCIPVKNDSDNLELLLKSIFESDIHEIEYEIIVCDGGSADEVDLVVQKWIDKLNLKLLITLNGTASINLNKGISEAQFDIFCRIDSHCKITSKFFSIGVKQLETHKEHFCAVGPFIVAKPLHDSRQSIAIAKAFVSPFFMGPSKFKASKCYTSIAGEVETIYLGFFWTKDLRAVGGFNESIERKQDIELLKRLKSHTSKKLYQSSEARITYVLKQDTIKSILKRAFKQGVLATQFLDNVRLQHFIPMFFFSLGAASTILFPNVFLFGLAAYLIVSFIFLYVETRRMMLSFVFSPLFPACHLSYVLGNVKGFVNKLFDALGS